MLVAAAALIGFAAATPRVASAEGLFDLFFGGFQKQQRTALPQASFFADPFGLNQQPAPPPRPVASGSGPAFCVRSCDGRYFPVQGPDRESRASSCSNFCPAAKTEVVYGGDIDNAVTDSGKPYSDLPNAFRYRDELVAGCTCNGKEPAGLAQVPVQSDPTLRRGDIVASENGLVVTRRAADRHAAANFSPVPESVCARYGRAPVVASGR